MKFRNLILSAAVALVGGYALASETYRFSTTPFINEWIVEKQDTVNRLGNDAPALARAAVVFSRLPQDLLNLIVPPAAAQTNSQQTILNPLFRGHVAVACGTKPTVANATVTSGSCDYRGRFTAPTNGTVTITFGTAYLSAPFCDFTRTDSSSSGNAIVSVSTTAITVTQVPTGATVAFNWRCDGVMQ